MLSSKSLENHSQISVKLYERPDVTETGNTFQARISATGNVFLNVTSLYQSETHPNFSCAMVEYCGEHVCEFTRLSHIRHQIFMCMFPVAASQSWVTFANIHVLILNPYILILWLPLHYLKSAYLCTFVKKI